MKIKQLLNSLDNLKETSLKDLKDFTVRGISCNSKTAGNDFVFVAIKGNRQDGNKFIDEAISRGARVVVAESGKNHKSQFTNHKSQVIEVSNTRKALAKLAAEFYGNPSKKLKVVGVTGTNGKTTITYLLEALLKQAQYSPAVIGTINYRFKDKIIASNNTTPGPLELQSMMAQMLRVGVDYAVMEVSSHSLDQDRVEASTFHSAIFTNLTQDHLDYHKTLENYFKSKSKLFKMLDKKSFAVINNDDKYGHRLKDIISTKVITYGIDKNSDITAKDIKFDLTHTEFDLISPKGEAKITSKLIGRHNVYNILAVVAWAIEEGIDFPLIKSSLKRFCFVPGRLERIDSRAGFYVFVDYAHSEDALKNILQTLRPLTKNRIIVVFGCGGERDKTKRPKMAGVVSRLSDYAIVTNDNPRSEDPHAIIKDIKKGFIKDNYSVILERRAAIRKSLDLAGPGDIVLVAGKGHEHYQILKDKTIHFDDREVIGECLRSLEF